MSDSADAASLRLAFNHACETYPRHLAAFLSKEGEAAFRTWWGQFYDAVHNRTAGLDVLAVIAELREQIKNQTPAAPGERG